MERVARVALLAVGISALLASAQGRAKPLGTGARMPEIHLADQHDRQGTIGPATRIVLFTRDMEAGDFVKEALAEDGSALLAAANAVYIADISGMPGLIAKVFALPAMRKRPYRMLLDRDGKATADFPSEKGKVTALHLDAFEIGRVDYIDSSEGVLTVLHEAREPTPSSQPSS
jgi:hypothetical protein